MSRIDVENKQQELQKLNEAFVEREVKKQQHMVDLAMALLNVAQHQNEREFQMEEIFIEGNDQVRRFRGNLQDLLKLVKFAYSTDPLTIHDQGVLLEIQEFINERRLFN